MAKKWIRPRKDVAAPVSGKDAPKSPDEKMPSKPTRASMRYGAKTVKKG